MSPIKHISATAAVENQSTNSVGSTTIHAEESSPYNNDLTAFFAIGMVLNVLLVGAFIIWGFKQWKKK